MSSVRFSVAAGSVCVLGCGEDVAVTEEQSQSIVFSVKVRYALNALLASSGGATCVVLGAMLLSSPYAELLAEFLAFYAVSYPAGLNK